MQPRQMLADLKKNRGDDTEGAGGSGANAEGDEASDDDDDDDDGPPPLEDAPKA